MDALALLRLQVEWGADEVVDLEPIDRLRPVRQETAGLPASAGLLQSSRGAATLPNAPVAAPGAAHAGSPAVQALAAAGAARTLNELRAAMAAFEGCALRVTASNLVGPEGDPDAGLLMIGEPPNADEDRGGKPFAGAEGALMDKMLASIGLDRGQALFAPLIPWRPPGARHPHPGELAACLPFLHRLIVLAQPRRIVVWGGLAARQLLSQAGGATAGRRRPGLGWIEMRVPGLSAPVPVLALPALAALLKTPPLRRDAWAGLRLLRRALDQDLAGPA